MMAEKMVMKRPNEGDAASALFSVAGVGDMIVNALERHAERTAFVCQGEPITYAHIAQQISRTLQYFEALGLKRGDAIMQLTGNRHEMFVVMAAAFIGGYVSVIPNYSASFEDHRYMLEDSGAVLLVVDAARASRGEQLLAAAQRPLRLAAHDPVPDTTDFWGAVERYTPRPLEALDQPADNIRLIYTGGTTGVPKGVMTESRALAFASLLHIAEQGFDTAVRLLVSSPLSHGAGALVIPVLVKGGTVVIHDGFDVDKTLEAIAQRQATVLFVVPTMLYMLMDHPRIGSVDLRGLRRIIYTAAPISESRLAHALSLFGPILHQNYGQTEVPGTILALTAEDHLHPHGDKLTSAGKPYPCVAVRLVDENDNVLPRGGSIGELCVRAPHVTRGYWNKPEATNELLRDGWLHTGDMAFQDNDGYFHIVDRKKDMIISGGFNVYPQEVENSLASHPAIANAAVIGVPHEKWGEAVKAIVVLRAGSSATEQALIAHVRERKGPTMAPKTVEFVDSLPLTALGKIDKKALRAQYWQGHAKAVA
ncbi:acyl-CoA synthetase [Cupriavidus pauculus]|uniref:Acyl-CoA synthetase n=2 Tax=Cupriavidus pauculus TaxID=82633 RepID=A0A2N5C8A1_9BURK|nr:acyl-CoA synthetase [Cupriavidus pauculus]